MLWLIIQHFCSVLHSFIGSIENYVVFALMFCRFYLASRTLFTNLGFFLGYCVLFIEFSSGLKNLRNFFGELWHVARIYQMFFIPYDAMCYVMIVILLSFVQYWRALLQIVVSLRLFFTGSIFLTIICGFWVCC